MGRRVDWCFKGGEAEATRGERLVAPGLVSRSDSLLVCVSLELVPSLHMQRDGEESLSQLSSKTEDVLLRGASRTTLSG